MIEDFCRETDRYMEFEKKNRDDLQMQVSNIFINLNVSIKLIFHETF